MFAREHHRRIAAVLGALDADLLRAHACLFGGGTAMALRYGEYRESVDIDFLVSDLAGYRALRQRLSGVEGMQALARPGTSLVAVRETRADQYGIRTLLACEGVPIKFEIVLEGRMVLDPPGADDQVLGVSTLTPRDMAAGKLLANSDRWRDDAVFSRDLIDLAMMAPSRPLLRHAAEKARGAYGASIDTDLAKAVAFLGADPKRLDRCMQAMAMHDTPRALLWQRIRSLKL